MEQKQDTKPDLTAQRKASFEEFKRRGFSMPESAWNVWKFAFDAGVEFKGCCKVANDANIDLQNQILEMQSEIEPLQQENERLREALARIDAVCRVANDRVMLNPKDIIDIVDNLYHQVKQ